LAGLLKAEIDYVNDMHGKDSDDAESLRTWEPHEDARQALTRNAEQIKKAQS
jgi:hypothetical protein